MAAQGTLGETLDEVRRRIERAGSKKRLNEQETKATLIEPVLRALGWDTEDVEEVAREYRHKRQHKPVDYGLLILRTPRLLVEAKALGANLGDHRWISQIIGYASQAGVEWIVLTNGDEYRIFNTHAVVPVEEKLLRSVQITDDSELVRDTLELLSRARLEENRLKVLWDAHFVDQHVNSALEDLFGGDNDMVIVNHVIKHAKNLSADDVRASLRRCKYQFDFPVSPGEIIKPSRRGKKPKGKKAKAEVASYDVSLADLIEARLLRPPVALTRRYKGKNLTATILGDGRVEFAGHAYESLSQAGGMARATVIGRREDGKIHPTNGWTFWKLADEGSGKLTVDSVRQAFLDGARGEAKKRGGRSA